VLEIIPAYSTVHIFFDPLKLSREELQAEILKIRDRGDEWSGSERTIYTIPVLYGGEHGPDIGFVAEHTGLSEEQLIKVHTEKPLRIYMLGFTPGFPYCENPREIGPVPRLSRPRTKVPEGSVGFAGIQTGIYPVESPGGWRLVGKTPVRIFRSSCTWPFLFSPGDCIQFVAVDKAEYDMIRGADDQGDYVPVKTETQFFQGRNSS
jgi:inhibitor of KinA